MPNVEKSNWSNTQDKTYLPDYICGYKIEREYGNKKIEDCIKELVLLHTTK